MAPVMVNLSEKFLFVSQKLEVSDKNFTLNNLEEGVEYCVAAEISGIAIKKTIRSNWSCAFSSPADSRTGELNFLVHSHLRVGVFQSLVGSGPAFQGAVWVLTSA